MVEIDNKREQLVINEIDDKEVMDLKEKKIQMTSDKRLSNLNKKLSKTSLIDCDFNISETLYKVLEFIDWEFDYEIGAAKLEENQIKILKTTSSAIKYEPLVLTNLGDTAKIEINNGLNSKIGQYIRKANCIKRMVSLKKRRLENDLFDLDLAYITKRVIAMGIPTTGCESIYRNSLSDIKEFIARYHSKGAKIYNLCIEKERIYVKSHFNVNTMNSLDELYCKDINCKVGFFPFKDHNPPPIKLILEFCVDICIYLAKNPDAVALIHCKAGKGRTGLMIVCYLIFSELFSNVDDALKHFAFMRTHNNKGITIPSQIRYVKYFEMFLKLNYKRPYIRMIPKIIKTQFLKSLNSNNMISNYLRDKSYFLSPNTFKIKEIKIGPFNSKVKLGVKLFNNELKELKFLYDDLLEEEIRDNETCYYFNLCFTSKVSVQTDIKFDICGLFSFYFWLNLWYSTVDYLYQIINDKNLQMDSNSVDGNSVKDENVKGKTSNEKSEMKLKLKEYLDTFNTNSDLNEFINLINQTMKELQLKEIEKDQLLISLEKFQLDKFHGAKSMKSDFKVIVLYELEKN